MKEFLNGDLNSPECVILSHRWESEEISFQDFTIDKGKQKKSCHKIERLCRIARNDKIDWVWLDSCCIEIKNSTRLSEAINSMYKWYEHLEYCVAYLFDVEDAEALTHSSWFESCWTLQELIAISDFRTYDKDWTRVGQKSNMIQQLSLVTGIDEDTLCGGDPRERSIAQRMSWASRRKATRIEDESCSLLGLFDISMPVLYRDGKRASMALQERNSSDLR